ncbi:hypothetical protein N7492_000219 [Penicillium capsulatum]|uniref:RNA 3'-terminal phosphate cyclase domain-containing protein n=1 Tax=Penicillium capsulatum TaxID=69766 RepID=A0A9W9LYH6_9EURO|nr:hypothetical protein N7492_000219 [Penicillium capsulatum]
MVDGSDAPQRSSRHVHLDGRTLEGGGQLVRNAVALSALTGRPVTIDHVRGNRRGKTGLKSSHAAAIKLLAEISGSKIPDGRVGAQSVTFEPQSSSGHGAVEDTTTPDSLLVPLSNLTIKPEYDIRLATPGSAFLIFQALYPYLLHVGSQAAVDCIRLTITGGTNGSHSLSYDYAVQVMAPNFARLGLPPLSIALHKRGWSTGPVGMGSVIFSIYPFETPGCKNREPNDRGKNPSDNEAAEPPVTTESRFPQIDIMKYQRGKITKIDLTVLATDSTVDGERLPLRKYVEQTARKALRQALATVDPSMFETLSNLNISTDEVHGGKSDQKYSLPIAIHTSEPTSHVSRLYLLIVAHTSTGFRIGHDGLLENIKSHKPDKKKHKNVKKNRPQRDKGGGQQHSELSRISELIEQCVEGFRAELSDEPVTHMKQPPHPAAGNRSPLDAHMRDQIVVFEALGSLGRPRAGPAIPEDERFWTLHTQTAQWVCRRMLGPLQEE